MKNAIIRQIILSAAVAILSTMPAQSETIYGLWQTYDLDSGEPAEQVRISPYNDHEIGGWIASIRSNPDTLCGGNPETMRVPIKKDARLFFDIQQDTDHQWSGDAMLDFCDGELSPFTITLSEDANTLTVTTKGIISLFNQSQNWDRVTPAQ